MEREREREDERGEKKEHCNEMELGTCPFNTKFVSASREPALYTFGSVRFETNASKRTRCLVFPLSASKLPLESSRDDRAMYIPRVGT